MILCLLLALFPQKLAADHQPQIVFWNIGQGQWITAANENTCYHFDVGGEFFNAQKISSLCSNKQNMIFYSHWDWDHIGLTHQLKSNVQSLCISVLPQGNAKKYKLDFINKNPKCETDNQGVELLKFNYANSKTDNDLSHIFIYKKNLLIPGDSTKKFEKRWAQLVKGRSFQWLSVSHHGSKTSTSKELLKSIIAKQAIISARKKVYGHPHKEVLMRLKEKGIATLQTEHWGNIRIITYP